ncbi:hypothetical protein GCM10009736_29040 [Actinomadura bangladeshensis]
MARVYLWTLTCGNVGFKSPDPPPLTSGYLDLVRSREPLVCFGGPRGDHGCSRLGGGFEDLGDHGGIDVGGEGRPRMPQRLADRLHLDSGCQGQRGCPVTQVVEPDGRERPSGERGPHLHLADPVALGDLRDRPTVILVPSSDGGVLRDEQFEALRNPLGAERRTVGTREHQT